MTFNDNKAKHIKYFRRIIEGLPEPYAELDTSRMTVLYFAVVALDMLGALDTVNKTEIADFVYRCQLNPTYSHGGFIGSPFMAHDVCCPCNAASKSDDAEQNGKQLAPEKLRNGCASAVGTTPCTTINAINLVDGDSNNSSGSSRSNRNFCSTESWKRNTDKRSSLVTNDNSEHLPNKDLRKGEKGIIDVVAAGSVDCREEDNCCGCPLAESGGIHDQYHQGHLAMTYTALMILLTIGDDLQRLDTDSILRGLATLQDTSGAFRATESGSESDMRFLFCACVISFVLGDWSAVDVSRAVGYIESCVTYEGGISLIPGAEAQGGATYCATAALSLMGELESFLGMDTTIENHSRMPREGCLREDELNQQSQPQQQQGEQQTGSGKVSQIWRESSESTDASKALLSSSHSTTSPRVLVCDRPRVSTNGEAAASSSLGRGGGAVDSKYAKLVDWCERRQVGGYQGRTNKDPDSCYSFWIGGTLHMLGRFPDTDLSSTRGFLLNDCQNPLAGGFSKYPGAYPDVLHSFYSLSWLAMCSEAQKRDDENNHNSDCNDTQGTRCGGNGDLEERDCLRAGVVKGAEGGEERKEGIRDDLKPFIPAFGICVGVPLQTLHRKR